MVSVTILAPCILGMPVATSRGFPIVPQVSLELSGSATATGVERSELEINIGLINARVVYVACVCVECVKEVDTRAEVASLDGLV